MAAVIDPNTKPLPQTIGAISDRLWQLREDKKKLAEQEKSINGQIAALELLLFERMDKEGTTKGAGRRASVSLGEQTIFQFDTDNNGYDLFVKFVARNKFYHLFERRISQLATAEVFAKKGMVPGLKVFKKRTINLTTTSPK
jgi:hypothetical protein